MKAVIPSTVVHSLLSLFFSWGLGVMIKTLALGQVSLKRSAVGVLITGHQSPPIVSRQRLVSQFLTV